MRVLLIDDEQLVLDGMDAYLQVAIPDLSVDKASDASAALRLASNLPYRLVLLDLNLVDEAGTRVDGPQVIEDLRRGGCNAPILLISGEDPTRCRKIVRQLGLSGYLPKTATGAALVGAIHTVMTGGVAMPDDAAEARARAAARRHVDLSRPEPSALRRSFPELTERQAEILHIMMRGAGDKQIAREMNLSLNTVRTHVRGVLAAVGVSRRGEAVYRAGSDSFNAP